MIKRALISVYDKTGIADFAKYLSGKGVEVISTGGTYRHLKENGIEVKDITELTGFKEILDGRVKTLHPIVHAGILAIRNNEEHMKVLEAENIGTIDMVVVNLYPFFEKVKEEISFEEKIEFIDIGGPTMLRSSAKNFQDVVVICDPENYETVRNQLEENGEVDLNTKKKLAGKVFNLTSAYDAAISNFMLDDEYPEYYTMSLKKKSILRYGENPHQSGAVYENAMVDGAMNNFKQLHGKELSYNNYRDMDIAWKVVNEFEEIACCGLKHNSPCGVAVAQSVCEAYQKAYECDPVSIFGGIVSFNRNVDFKTAEELKKLFFEIVIAPGYDDDALELLKKKKNLRIIIGTTSPNQNHQVISVDGAVLVQQTDRNAIEKFECVTEKNASEKEIRDMEFGMKVVKYVKSNAIVIVKDGRTLGIGGGQVNRIWPTQESLKRSENPEGAVLASDAFFPFADVVDEAKKYGITAIVQPGGSIRDKDSIEACNKYGISMVFTGIRHFMH